MASFEELTEEQRVSLARAGHKLFHNPEVSKAAKKLLMQADPSIKFAEIETEDRIGEQLAARDKKIEEMEQRHMNEEAERRLEKRRDDARARGLDPADVEKAIIDRKIGDWDTAMRFVELERMSAPATPESMNPIVAMPAGKDLWNNPRKYATTEAHRMIDDLKMHRRSA